MSEIKVQCHGLTRSGARCQRLIKAPESYCFQHKNQQYGRDYYVNDIEKITLENQDYRRVLFTTNELQLVVMRLKPNMEIGSEIHDQKTQFIRIESGFGKAVLNDREISIQNNSVIIIPAGMKHNIVNMSASEDMKLYTVYAPPDHDPNCVQPEKTADDCSIEK